MKYSHTHTHTYVHARARTHARTHACTHIYVQKQGACAHAHLQLSLSPPSLSLSTHAHTHTHTHTHCDTSEQCDTVTNHCTSFTTHCGSCPSPSCARATKTCCCVRSYAMRGQSFQTRRWKNPNVMPLLSFRGVRRTIQHATLSGSSDKGICAT